MTSLRPFALQPVAQRGLGVGLVMAKLTFRREAPPAGRVATRATSIVAGNRNQRNKEEVHLIPSPNLSRGERNPIRLRGSNVQTSGRVLSPDSTLGRARKKEQRAHATISSETSRLWSIRGSYMVRMIRRASVGLAFCRPVSTIFFATGPAGRFWGVA
jgi:hypothetical protein